MHHSGRCGYLLFHNSTSYLDTQHLHINDWKCANLKNWRISLVCHTKITASSMIHYTTRWWQHCLFKVLVLYITVCMRCCELDINHPTSRIQDHSNQLNYFSHIFLKVFLITSESFVQRSCLNKNFHELCFAISVIAWVNNESISQMKIYQDLRHIWQKLEMFSFCYITTKMCVKRNWVWRPFGKHHFVSNCFKHQVYSNFLG